MSICIRHFKSFSHSLAPFLNPLFSLHSAAKLTKLKKKEKENKERTKSEERTILCKYLYYARCSESAGTPK